MKRGCWVKPIGFGVVGIAMLAGVAWADPIGAANLRQIVDGALRGQPGGGNWRTFLTTDTVSFEASYYDPNPACDGVAPTFVQLFLFTQEGRFVQTFDATSGADSPPFSKYRDLVKSFASVASIPLAPGSYKWTFLVRDCTNTKSVVLPEFVTFSVFAP